MATQVLLLHSFSIIDSIIKSITEPIINLRASIIIMQVTE